VKRQECFTWLGVEGVSQQARSLMLLCATGLFFVSHIQGGYQKSFCFVLFLLLNYVSGLVCLWAMHIATRRLGLLFAAGLSSKAIRCFLSYTSVPVFLLCIVHSHSPSLGWISWRSLGVHNLEEVFIVKKVASALFGKQNASCLC
jgi:hypothetical protein